MRIGIVYGSDTGVTEEVVSVFQETILDPEKELVIIEVCDIESTEDFLMFDLLILGLPTWYDGDLQSDWEDYFDTFETIDFTGKIVAIFGLGDQIGYEEYFIDGVGILAESVLKNGGTLIGNWPSVGYQHLASKALKDDHTFYGLALDEDNEHILTEERVEKWLKQLYAEHAKISETHHKITTI